MPISSHNDFYVYVWRNDVNGRRYVGKGRGDRAFASTKQGRLLPKAVEKYGLSSFYLEFAALDISEAAAHAEEIRLIQELGTQAPIGYNLSTGGEGASGYRHTAEAKEKIAAASRSMSPESRAKISEAQRGPHPERGPAISAALRGKKRKWSAEALAKRAAHLRANPLHKGHKHSEETREKMRARWRERKARKLALQ